MAAMLIWGFLLENNNNDQLLAVADTPPQTSIFNFRQHTVHSERIQTPSPFHIVLRYSLYSKID